MEIQTWEDVIGKPEPDFVLLPVLRGIDEIIHVLLTLEKYDAFVCGGYARYCASPLDKPIKAGDVDIYCKNMDTFDMLYQHFKYTGLEVRFDSDVAVTYKKAPKNHWYSGPVIQLIKPIDQGAIVASGEMETILSNFDFSVIRCGIVLLESGQYMVMADKDFMRDETKKFLRIKNIHCPISSLLRFMKYARKGYDTRPVQLAKLFADWDNRSDAYRERLLELFTNAEAGDLTKDEIDNLEALLRID